MDCQARGSFSFSRVVELLRAELQKAGAATRKSSAIRAQVEAARRAEEHRRWQEERQKGEERRRREEALVRDLDKRLDLWLAAVRYRQLADAVETMGPAGGDEDPRARWLVWLRSYVARVEQEVIRELPDPERGPEPGWRY